MYNSPRAHVDALLEEFEIPLIRYTELLPNMELAMMVMNARFGEAMGKLRGLSAQTFLEYTSMAVFSKPDADVFVPPSIAVHPCIAPKGTPFKHSGQYAVLLHEMGHLRHPTGAMPNDEWPEKEMIEEISAWQWALDTAMPEFWTPDCTNAMILGFESRVSKINSGNWPDIKALVNRAKGLEGSAKGLAKASWAV